MVIMNHMQTLAEQRGREMPGWSASKIENVIARIEVGSEYEQVEEPLDETLE